MPFEFDPAKSAANKDKHGIDFVEAQAMWLDDRLIEAPARDDREPRRMAIGRIGDRIWTAIFIMRSDVLRLISVRRARDREVRYYEEQ